LTGITTTARLFERKNYRCDKIFNAPIATPPEQVTSEVSPGVTELKLKGSTLENLAQKSCHELSDAALDDKLPKRDAELK
jgi:hypothetical protein